MRGKENASKLESENHFGVFWRKIDISVLGTSVMLSSDFVSFLISQSKQFSNRHLLWNKFKFKKCEAFRKEKHSRYHRTRIYAALMTNTHFESSPSFYWIIYKTIYKKIGINLCKINSNWTQIKINLHLNILTYFLFNRLGKRLEANPPKSDYRRGLQI